MNSCTHKHGRHTGLQVSFPPQVFHTQAHTQMAVISAISVVLLYGCIVEGPDDLS